MAGITDERAAWIADNVLAHEASLRRWLGHRRTRFFDVDDIVQETYAIMAGLEAVSHIHSPKAYVFATAHSIILRNVRRAKTVSIEAIEDIEALAGPDELSPERLVAGRQDLRRIAELIATLPAKCRQAFTLRKVEGLSQKDVARRMGISENTVEKHVGKGVRLLMVAFADHGNDDADALRAKGRQASTIDVETGVERRNR